MTVQDCLNKLQKEKRDEIGSRFPCRVILVKSRTSYRQLYQGLNSLCDAKVSSEMLFSGADVMPAYNKLIDKLDRGEWLILPGVSEYLRLFSKSEVEKRRFASLWDYMADADCKGRILIPLWHCETQWYDKALHFTDDIRKNDYIYSCEEEDEDERLTVRVFSDAFESNIGQLSANCSLFVGLQEWYESFLGSDEPFRDYCLLTKQVRAIAPISGDITISVIKDAFSFIRENLSDGHILSHDLCPEAALQELIPQAIKGYSLNQAILSVFNIQDFNGLSVLSGWNTLSKGKKQLFKLWYHFNEDNTYICRCVQNAQTVENIESHILLDIFDAMQKRPEWIPQCNAVYSAMKLKKTDAFFAALDKIPVFEDRLAFLSTDTKEERVYLLNTIGKWMKQDTNQVLASEKLKESYPTLTAYLQKLPCETDLQFDEYFTSYKTYKLSNTLPQDLDAYFQDINPGSFPFRYSLLKQNLIDDTVVLWIDAMGIEYMPLLYHSLIEAKTGKIVFSGIGQANLPTETCFNEQWNQMDVPYEKKDKLDKLAHKGIVDEPDYYSCIEESFSFIQSIPEVVKSLFQQYRRVIITGDHGTSRLAARFFHEWDGWAAPKDAKVLSHGRFCQLGEKEHVPYDSLCIAKIGSEKFMAFKDYHHFKIGGFAAGNDDDNAIYGEVHGGATPEEMLVPIIAVDNPTALPLTADWENTTVKIKRAQVTTSIIFNQAIKNLQIKLGSVEGQCVSDISGKKWTVTFPGIKKGTYTAVLNADGKLVSIEKELTVKSALGDDEDQFSL